MTRDEILNFNFQNTHASKVMTWVTGYILLATIGFYLLSMILNSLGLTTIYYLLVWCIGLTIVTAIVIQITTYNIVFWGVVALTLLGLNMGWLMLLVASGVAIISIWIAQPSSTSSDTL